MLKGKKKKKTEYENKVFKKYVRVLKNKSERK